jgi:Ima1 N-terminal domain
VGWTEGGGREVGLGRERIEARRKKVRLTMRTRATRERRKVVWEGERSVSCERPSRSKREDIVQGERRWQGEGAGSDRLLCPLCFLYLRKLHLSLPALLLTQHPFCPSWFSSLRRWNCIKMAPTLRRRLNCHYCGKRSNQKQKDGRRFKCEHCEAVNFLDEVSTLLFLRLR